MRGFAFTSANFRARARRRLPRFPFDYIDGGAGAGQTLAANVDDWARLRLRLRQRVRVDVGGVDTTSELLGERCALPLALAPIGLAAALLDQIWAEGCRTAVFTIELPVLGPRRRDPRHGARWRSRA